MATTNRHSTNGKAVTIPVSGSKQQVDEYVDMNGKSCHQAATMPADEYVDMNGKSCCQQTATVQADEYVDVNGKSCHQNDPHQEDSSMYIDMETAQNYEVPVGKKKTS